MRKITTALLAMLLVAGIAAIASERTTGRRDILVSFDGGIGVIPVLDVSGEGTSGAFPEVRRNVVRGVIPAGAPWRIADLRAVVESDGRIRVRGRGLLVAGGNNPGQFLRQKVFATLFCETEQPFVPRNTSAEGVALEPNGDFRIDDTLEPPPSDCPNPVLLIRTRFGGAWFAAGIPDLGAGD
jgi:hypothetical protein